MDLGLRDKVAIVTGGTRGIGKASAAALLREGARVVICGRTPGTLREAEAELSPLGEVSGLELDVTDADAPARLVSETTGRFGRVDILFSNVGGNRRKPFLETTDEDWAELHELNLGSHIRLARAVAAPMKEQGQGVILFNASIFGREAGGPELTIYNTTKAGMISLAKIMALDLAPFGIRVNSIAPGSILFPGGSWHKRREADPDGIARFVERNLPLGRFGHLDEVADFVAFMVSERASLLTGSCVNVDGGQSRSLI
ncbi:short-chain dehydrogenase [Acidobacteria bacterium Mor1]|nr:short-chain dehydrogenase [Acidobacteria bacterium Mor1]